jgi:hypothetical protein
MYPEDFVLITTQDCSFIINSYSSELIPALEFGKLKGIDSPISIALTLQVGDS